MQTLYSSSILFIQYFLPFVRDTDGLDLTIIFILTSLVSLNNLARMDFVRFVDLLIYDINFVDQKKIPSLFQQHNLQAYAQKETRAILSK